MCGRFVVLTEGEIAEVVSAVQKRLDGQVGLPGGIVRAAEVGRDRAHAHPGDEIALFGFEDACGRRLREQRAVWGFAPEWSTRAVINTRVEKMISGSAMWREIAQDGRCVIPAYEFFEPHETEMVRSRRSGKLVKRAYRFGNEDGSPLLLAGVQAGGRCSVVTCAPNRWVSPVHSRMPLVLRFEEVSTWLEGDWASLADRGSYRLSVEPEFPDAVPASEQLSLF